MLSRISGIESSSPVLIRKCPSSEGDEEHGQVVGADGVEVADHPVTGERPRPAVRLGGDGGGERKGKQASHGGDGRTAQVDLHDSHFSLSRTTMDGRTEPGRRGDRVRFHRARATAPPAAGAQPWRQRLRSAGGAPNPPPRGRRVQPTVTGPRPRRPPSLRPREPRPGSPACCSSPRGRRTRTTAGRSAASGSTRSTGASRSAGR